MKRFFFLMTVLTVLGMAGSLYAMPMLLVDDPDNIISNGSFEEPALNGGWAVFNPLTGWEVLGGSGAEIQDMGNAYHLDQHLELDSHNNSKIGQTFTVVDQMEYWLQFAYVPRTGMPNDNTIAFGIEGINGTNFSWTPEPLNGTNPPQSDWELYNYLVNLEAGDYRLYFAAEGISNSYGGYVDAVGMKPTPEPGTMALLGLGLAGIIAYRRRKAA